MKILQRIEISHWRFLLQNENPSEPTTLLISILPVPPMCIRPTVPMGGGKTNEDDLTIKLLEI